MTLRSSAALRSSCALLFVFTLLTIASSAHAAKDYCRKIELLGQAGGSMMNPNKPVTFFVKNQVGTVINTSCDVIADNNETALHYVKRLPFAWGDGLTACPPTGYIEDDPDNKTRCRNYAGGSCIVKYKVAPKDTGAKKNYAEICCYQGGDCSGPKLSTPIPITLQLQSGDLCPLDPNSEDPDLCVVDPDPMGMAQLPSPTGAKCRAGITAAVGGYIAAALQTYVECEKFAMSLGLPPNPSCETDDSKGAIAAAATKVQSAAAVCQASRSPAALGYHQCPAPCDAISLGGCSAGNGAAMCQNDRDCDTAPGSGDGKCGDWTATADCLVCVAQEAVTTAASDKYGSPPVAPSDEAMKCQNTIGVVLAKLAATRINATLGCQKKRDAGKQPLALGQFCKDLDLGGAIAAAEQAARDAIASKCDSLMLAELDVCGGATDAMSIGQCMVDNVHTVNEAFSFAVVPSSSRKCGDDLKSGFEECDGTDDAACPGACTGLCKCGVVSPVTQSLNPCEPSVIDRWAFQVNSGDNVSVQADTTNLATASDLCFAIGSGCDTGDDIQGDDEAPCTFPSPNGHDCPHDTLVASDDGICTVEVTECIGDCANAGVGDYQLTVTRNGLPATMVLLNDNEP